MANLSVESLDDGILIKSNQGLDQSSQYDATVAGPNAMLVHKVGVNNSIGMLDVDSFENLVMSLVSNHWTGKVTATFGEAKKTMFLSNGRFIFAGSNQIDDRLGEVMYRRGMISLDNMMDAAVLVTKDKKFGQICLEKDIFTNEDLWLALRAQAITVLKSIFMQESVTFSMEQGIKAPTEIALWESTRNIIAQCASYGAMFRFLKTKITDQTEVRVSQVWKELSDVKAGSFVGDLVSLCEEKLTFSAIREASQLLDDNDYAEILNLYVSGALALSGEGEVSQQKTLPHLAGLKSLIEGYEMVVSTINKVYDSVGKKVPVEVCRSVISKIDSQICPSIFIGDNLHLTPGSLELIFAQCIRSSDRSSIMEENIRGMIQFVVLAAGDSLPYEQASEVKKFYKTVIQ